MVLSPQLPRALTLRSTQVARRMDCGSSWALLRVTAVAVVYVGRAQVTARCAGGLKGSQPQFPLHLQGCFAAILPSFLSVRGCNSPRLTTRGSPEHTCARMLERYPNGASVFTTGLGSGASACRCKGRSPSGRGSRRGEASRTKRAQHPNGSHAIASNRRPRNVDARRANIGGCASGPSSAEARPRPGGNCNGVSSRSFRRRE